MIIFIDDERWAIEGYLDMFDSKQVENKLYSYKFFFSPQEAKPFLSENIKEIKLIILDIMLDYGDDIQNNEETDFENGGIKFLKELREDKNYDNIPIITYTIVDKKTLRPYLENENVFYLDRDCSDIEFYSLVDKCIGI